MRPKIKRNCRHVKGEQIFKPAGIPLNELEISEITLDEFEAIRLCDLEDYSQVEACEKMGVSRRTFQRILKSGRKKIVDSILKKKALKILDKQ